MTAPNERAASEEHELQRLAEAIADGEPTADRVSSDGATSPLLRHMAAIAETAKAFQEAGPAPQPAPSGALFHWGPLEAQRKLGEGSFGEVYAAWDPQLRREVALKLRLSGAGGGTRRWLDEARALALVRHPNVLTVYGADEHDGRVGMWTDLVLGRDLETILQQQGPFSAREAASIGLELCSALAAVHARGLVHGDVKTRNVMRAEGGDSPGRIVLMDFGSAHEASLEVTAGRGRSIGTPLAMAPEALRGEAATPASDLYSLGVLLFRLVSGRYPIEATTLDELRQKHEHGERAALRTSRPDLSAEFVQVVERALEPDPRHRFADAAAMERALHAAVSGATPSRPGLNWIAVALVLVVVAGSAIVWAISPWRARPTGTRDPVGPGGVSVRVPVVVPPGATSSGPTTGAPIASPALRAAATLYRLRAGESAPLASGGEIEPGDRLYLDVDAGEPVHTYVLDEDGSGRVIVLFPCAGADARNPLSAGVAHRLPGERGRDELNWLVTSAEGRETFLIVISRHPIATLEQSVAALPQARPADGLQYATLDDADLRALRGVGRMVREPVSAGSTPGRLTSLARSLGQHADAGDLWVRLVELDNPRN